ncbi:MAG: error-prone DNA polymerase, partial [Pseudomonadales bacterium]|nr:error-prone DNA polymerase [Pseudomonadales bacterium]
MACFPDQNNQAISERPLAYTELHCLSNFTFMRGASHPEELVSEATRLSYKGISITDECTLSGVVRAHQQAKQDGIKLLIGSEFKLGNNSTLIIIATHRQSYGQLSALITQCRRHAEKGSYQIHIEDIKRFIRAAVLILLPDYRDPDVVLLDSLSKHYKHSLWLGLNLHYLADEELKKQQLYQLANKFNCPLVACGSALMHSISQQKLQDTLTAIRHNQSIHQLGLRLESNAEHYLRPLETLQQIYPPETLSETQNIQQRCHFSLDELRYEYPSEVVPPGKNATQYLRELVMQGAQQRWPEGTPEKVKNILEKELLLINELRYEYYFLTVYDIVQFARSEGILCQGRGSAANSAVCFCLSITEVNPALNELLIERFISKERNEPPDIDVDFEHQRREEVIQFIYKKYGRDRAALAATVITYRPKSAIRDVGKALGFDLNQVEQMSKAFAWWDKRSEYLSRLQESGINTDTPTMQHFMQLVERILTFPRHLSQHVGGFIISQGPLSQLVPIENASMVDRTIIQWDKNDLQALGLMKVDILALGILTAIRKCFTYLSTLRGQQWTMAKLPAEDPKVYQMLQNGDSTGLFQVESRAQMAMLPRLKPVTFYDLVIQVAIVRPGPIQGKMVHPYLKRRQGLEAVHYANDEIKQVLSRTLGVPIFQEQVIKLAVVAAGFSAGEADQLRRAMARWKKTGELEPFQHKLKQGMRERHYPETFAEQICQQIQGFGE